MDVNRQTAAEIFGVPPDQVTPEQRRAGRVVNFGVNYGSTGAMPEAFGPTSVDTARARAMAEQFRAVYGGHRSGMTGFAAARAVYAAFEATRNDPDFWVQLERRMFRQSIPPDREVRSTVFVAALAGLEEG